MTRVAGAQRELFRLLARRERVRQPVLGGAVVLTVVGAVSALPGTYPTAGDLAERAELISSSATAQLFTGPGYGLDAYTYGAMTANELLPITLLAVALLTAAAAIRHSRADEESGAAELLTAQPLPRRSRLLAPFLVASLAGVVPALAITVLLPTLRVGLDWPGSTVFGAAVAVTGVVGAGLGLLAAECFSSARAASAAAYVSIAALYLVRSVADIQSWETLAWFTPFGWATRSRAFVADDPVPLLLGLALSGVVVSVAVSVNSTRDFGQGMLSARAGSSSMAGWVRGPWSFVLRLCRVIALSWVVALGVLGAIYGSLADQAAGMYADNEVLQGYLNAGGASPAEQFEALVLEIIAIGAAAAALQVVLRARGEESAGRSDSLLVTPMSRTSWLLAHVVLAVSTAGTGLLAGGVGLAVAASGTDASAPVAGLLLGGLGYLPGVAVLVALVGLVWSLAPWAASVAGWSLLGLVAAEIVVGPAPPPPVVDRQLVGPRAHPALSRRASGRHRGAPARRFRTGRARPHLAGGVRLPTPRRRRLTGRVESPAGLPRSEPRFPRDRAWSSRASTVDPGSGRVPPSPAARSRLV